MSKHPLGPWANSQGSINMNAGTSGTVQYQTGSPSSYNITAMPQGEMLSRTGYNAGPDHSTPRPASLTRDIRTVVRPWSAFDYVNSARTQWVSCKNVSWRPGEDKGVFDDPNTSTSAGRTLQQVQDLAYRKFVGKQGSNFSGLVFAGEFKESVDTCRDVLNRVTGAHNAAYQSLVKNLAKRKKGSISDLAREIADHNLGLQFAIMPTITDLKNLALSIQDKVVNDSFPIHTVSGSFVERNRKVRNEIKANYIFACKIRNVNTWFRMAKMGAQVKSSFIGSPEWVNDATYFGFDRHMLIPAAYELLPYSWLVDYFTNVGSLLESAALRRGIWENGWLVTIDQSNFESTCDPQYQTLNVFYTNRSGMKKTIGLYTRETFLFNRSPWDPNSYIPVFSVRSPNLQQSANVLSLAAKKLIPARTSQFMSAKTGTKVGRELRRILSR